MTVVKLKDVKGARQRVPQAPAHIAADPVARDAWTVTAKVLQDAGLLPAERLPLLENYAMAVSLVRRLDEAMAGQPTLIITTNGARVHPAIVQRTRAAATLATLASRLGLTERGPGLKGAKGDDGPDPYEDLGI